MNVARARLMLVAVLVVSLSIHLVVIGVAKAAKAITDADVETLVVKILTVYSVHLAAVLGAMFAVDKHASKRSAPATFWLALALTILWNLLLLWRSILFGVAVFDLTSDDGVGSLSRYWNNVASAGSFLVAAALAAFFATRESTQR